MLKERCDCSALCEWCQFFEGNSPGWLELFDGYCHRWECQMGCDRHCQYFKCKICSDESVK